MRGIAALVVVIFHTKAKEIRGSGGTSIYPDFVEFGSIGVDLFFVISGFVMAYTTQSHNSSFEYVRGFLFKRFVRVYPLYWFYTSLALIVFLIPSLKFSSHWDDANIWKSYLLLPDKGSPLIAVGWTLIHEVYFYLMFALSLFFKRDWIVFFLFAWALVVVAVNLLMDLETLGLYSKLAFSPLTLEFIFGAVSGVFLTRHSGLKVSGIFFIVIGLGMLLSGSAYHYVQTGSVPNGLWGSIFFGFCFSCIVYGGCIIESKSDHFSLSTFWLNLGNASYSLYLSHVLVISAISTISIKIIDMLNIELISPYLNLLLISLMLFSSIIFSLASYRYVEKPLVLKIKAIKH